MNNEAINIIEVKVRKSIAEYNKPGKPTVAINTLHIGDDNDYSCFLSGVVFELYKAGKK
jgi:hypothetical protein